MFDGDGIGVLMNRWPASVIWMVKAKEPGAVGMPERAPLAARERPGGRVEPVAREKV